MIASSCGCPLPNPSLDLGIWLPMATVGFGDRRGRCHIHGVAEPGHCAGGRQCVDLCLVPLNTAYREE